MSSAGQALGGLAGGIIGFFVGGPTGALYGAQLGMMAGGMIDPPKGPKIEGPRLSDLSVQGVGYGHPIPRVYGTIATFGTIFWVENNAIKETATTEEVGGKGGPSQEQTTYTYSATFALALCQGPIGGIRRIWISGKLVYDANGQDVSAILANVDFSGGVQGFVSGAVDAFGAAIGPKFTLYKGTDDQLPDTRMQATVGIANTPAYRGLAYLLFEDLQLADYGNSLMGAQIKVEVVPAVTTQWQEVAAYSVYSQYVNGVGIESDPTQFSANEAITTATGTNYRLYKNTITGENDYSYTSIPTTCAVINQADGMGGFVAKFGNPSVLILPPYATGPGLTSVDEIGEVVTSISDNDKNSLAHLASRDGVVWGSSTTIGDASVFKLGGARLASADSGIFFFHQESVFSFLYGDGYAQIKTYDDDFNYLATHTINYTNPGYTYGGVGGRLLAWKLDNIVYTLEGGWDNKPTGTLKIAAYDLDSLQRTEYSCPVLSHALIAWTVRAIAFRVWSHGLFSVFIKNINQTHPENPPNCSQLFFGRVAPATADRIPLAEIVSEECLRSGLLSALDIDVSALTKEVIGYKVTATGSIRSALEPLQFAFSFDAVQSGYEIRFVPRGAASSITVPYDDLGASEEGGSASVRVSEAREMDSQLPRRVEVTYLDYAREYDIGEQFDERLNTSAVNVLRVEMPIAMVADEAATVAQQSLYRNWVERVSLEFSLPPTYLSIEPSDVVTLDTLEGQRVVHVSSVECLPDGRLQVSGPLNESTIYSTVAIGEEGAFPGQVWVSPLTGPTRINLLDLPCLADANNAPGWGAALCGYDAAWRGANLYRSANSGGSWSLVRGISAPVTMGSTTNALGSGRTDLFDSTGSVNVRLYSNTLESSTFDNVLNGENHFAIGNDGRWEVVGVVTVTEEIDGTYTLTNLLRGRLGTEWAVSTHAVGDQVVLLNDRDLVFVEASLNDISLEREYKALGYGNSLDDGESSRLSYAYQGVNLKPLAPLHFRGAKTPTGTWEFEWIRQTRIGWLWRDGVDSALGEAAEKYEVDIFSDAGKTLKLATFETTNTSLAISPSQQTALFGAGLDSIHGRCYQISSSVGRGYASDFSIIGTDPYWNSCTLAVHFNGTNGQTTITDEKGASFSRQGTAAALSNAVVKFGDTSGSTLAGYNSYWYASDISGYQFAAGDFTIRCWIYLSTNRSHPVLYKGSSNGATVDFVLAINSLRQISFRCFNAAATLNSLTTTETVTLGTWVHIEFCRSGTTGMAFINGVKSATTATINNDIRATASAQLQIIGQSTVDSYDGYIDDLQIYKGVALHTASFTPPTQEFMQG